ncbi:FHA domain-containing protein [Hyphomicrobium sp.]|uniref:FHA domain-containing protein n=1 Tax=Hyphomicrobium sp. TaxID=82 RepID=UPI002FDF4EBF
MRRLARQREAIVVAGVLLSVIGSRGAGATETKLVAECREPAQAAGAAPASVSCDVRAGGFAVFEGVTAAIKGGTGELASSFKAFDAAERSTNTAYLIQLMPNARRATLAEMGDAVVTLTDRRQGRRRFSAYSYGSALAPIADSGTSKAEFVRQMIALKPAATKVQLYKAALEAIEALAREGGDRKALVILGDGTSDDAGDSSHDQVVAAAREAGVVIHVLGYDGDRADRTKFQNLSRLAEETGGYAAEIKQGAGRDGTKDVVSSRFVEEVLENGGTLKADLAGALGAETLVMTARLADGTALAAEQAIDVPAPPVPRLEATTPSREPALEPTGVLGAVTIPALIVGILAVLGGLGAFAYRTYIRREPEAAVADPPAPEPAPTPAPAPAHNEPVAERVPEPSATRMVVRGRKEAARDASGSAVVYGWLETMDGKALRHPLRTTDVHVGRHRDNDICLQNDSISRRHAVLHYDAGTRRVVITDLGGSNGVIVNRTKCASRELNDGDTVELGEVRLRFRAETGVSA